jgi:hypothetical protein
MSNLRIGISKENGFWGYFKPRSFYIAVPVDRHICVSWYLIQFTEDSIEFRREDKFFEDNRSTECFLFAISEKVEKDLVCWAKGNHEDAGLHTMGDVVLREILGIPANSENLYLDTRTPSNLKYILTYLSDLSKEE